MRRALIGIAAAAALLATAAAGGGGTAASSASADKDCSDFANQAQAQSYFTSNGGSASNDFDNLDADHDGVACESLPCPCSSSAGSGGGGGGGGQTAPKAKRVSARVVAAVDGDTLKVDLKNGEEWDVRLIGIDTPETVRPNTPVQCGGPQASTSMHGLADGRRVTLVSDPTQDRIDRYGRLLDYVFRGQPGPRQDPAAAWLGGRLRLQPQPVREGASVQARGAPRRERRPRRLEGLRRELPHPAVGLAGSEISQNTACAASPRSSSEVSSRAGQSEA